MIPPMMKIWYQHMLIDNDEMNIWIIWKMIFDYDNDNDYNHHDEIYGSVQEYVTPLLVHWNYVFLALSHLNYDINDMGSCDKSTMIVSIRVRGSKQISLYKACNCGLPISATRDMLTSLHHSFQQTCTVFTVPVHTDWTFYTSHETP